MSENDNRFPIAKRHLATEKLAEFLREHSQVGTILTDEQLSRIAERNTSVNGDGYNFLRSAMRIVRREHGVVWRRIPHANAIECCGFSQIMQLASRGVRHIQRSARVRLEELRCAPTNGVNDDQKREYLARIAQVGTLAEMANAGTHKKLVARNYTAPIDLTHVLSSFKELNNGDKGSQGM
jgi:hypothetical protein